METFMSLFPMQAPSLITILVFLSLLHEILRQLHRARKLSRQGRRGSHGPPHYPIVGCLISFYRHRSCLLDWYTQLLSESETNTIVVKRLGARRTIVTANPGNVEYILKTNFNNYPKGKPFTEILGDFLGAGIFNVDGDLWRAQRKLAIHEFSKKSLKEFMMKALEEEVGNKLVSILESAVEDRRAVDLQELLRRLAFNLICKVALGVDRCCLDHSQPASPLNKAFDVASEICARRGAAPLFLVWKIKKLLGVGSERRLKEAVDEVHAYVADIIEDKMRKMEEESDESGEEDLMSRLIMAGHEEKVIRDMVINFIMAGRDTTSAAMTWLFWLLSCHPNIEQELVKETMRETPEGEVDYESLKELKFLEACLNESMRLYPPVVWDSKHALADDILPDGIQVKGGDRVTYFPYGMGRMESLWGKDWFEFRPSRWCNEPGCGGGSSEKVSPFKFPIFHAGPRACLGKDMAFIQMKYVVACLIRRFEFRPLKLEKPVVVPLLTAHMAGGLKVWVHKRD